MTQASQTSFESAGPIQCCFLFWFPWATQLLILNRVKGRRALSLSLLFYADLPISGGRAGDACGAFASKRRKIKCRPSSSSSVMSSAAAASVLSSGNRTSHSHSGCSIFFRHCRGHSFAPGKMRPTLPKNACNAKSKIQIQSP